MSLFTNSSSNGKLPKIYFSEHNDRIIKEINNKIGPLKMSNKVKTFIERKNFLKRSTFNDYSYFKDKTWHSLEKDDLLNQQNLKLNNKLPNLEQTPSIKRYLRKSFTTADLKLRDSQQSDSYKEIDKIKMLRLPLIKQEIWKKKEELAKNLQYDSIVFQKDNFGGSQGKIYTLEYVMNRLEAHDERKKSKLPNKMTQPIKGYENLSPNMLKQYIQCFKRKKSLSKKQNTLAQSSKDFKQSEVKQHSKMVSSNPNVKSQKKIDQKSKKVIFITEENFSFQKDITEKPIQRHNSTKNQDRN